MPGKLGAIPATAKHRRPPAARARLRAGVFVLVLLGTVGGVVRLAWSGAIPASGAQATGAPAQGLTHRWGYLRPAQPRPLAVSRSRPVARRPGPAAAHRREHVSGRSVTAIGDSILVASTPAIEQALPGVYINAQVGRQFATGLAVLAGLKQQGLIRHIVVFALGTNGTVTPAEISQLYALIGPHRRLILVNTFAARPWEPEVNTILAVTTANHGRTTVMADWHDAVANRTYLLWPDGIHPQPAGAVVYARMLKAAIERAASLPG